jgi:hypothetical protein
MLSRNRFLRHYADPPRSAPDFITAIRMLTRWRRQRPDPAQHLDKQPTREVTFRQLQPVLEGVLD